MDRILILNLQSMFPETAAEIVYDDIIVYILYDITYSRVKKGHFQRH